jgi:hypothetical protein
MRDAAVRVLAALRSQHDRNAIPCMQQWFALSHSPEKSDPPFT